MLDFSILQIGTEYDRNFLAQLWGYRGFQAISKGVVTPSRKRCIILFVTKEKQENATQYNDYIDGNLLFWEGEKRHSNDQRIIDAGQNGEEIHLFYRSIHHTPFIYYGQVYLLRHILKTDKPSEFIFTVGKVQSKPNSFKDSEERTAAINGQKETKHKAFIKMKIGHGIFRDRLIKMWGECSVTGTKKLSLLKASHIKPWRDSSSEEQLDPHNGLLLIHNLYELFNNGFITFDLNGRILISHKLSNKDYALSNLTSDLKLRRVHEQNKKYLIYHSENVFVG